jgi:hypothetical protein
MGVREDDDDDDVYNARIRLLFHFVSQKVTLKLMSYLWRAVVGKWCS